MRLIEIARFVHRVEDRDALAQEDGRVAGALDLPHHAVADPGCAEEATLRRADRQPVGLLLAHGLDGGVADEQASARQPRHESVGVLEVRILPC